jgi:hypothetical protein
MRLTSRTLFLTLTAAVSCQPSRPAPTEPPWTAPLSDDAVVVAEVDGVPITAERVTRRATLTGRPPAEVLERLIEFELLAAEARHRGLHRDRETRLAIRKALVQQYLEDTFEASHQPDDMSEEMLRRSYEVNKSNFVRPRLVKVAHILVKAPAAKASPADRAVAHTIAHDIYREARKANDVSSFTEIGEAQKGRHKLEIIVERINQPVYEGAPFDEDFVKAALALKNTGDISRPVRSAFGSHVIYLIDVQDPINTSYREARERVRDREYPFWLKREFFLLTEELRYSTVVTGFSGERRRDVDL